MHTNRHPLNPRYQRSLLACALALPAALRAEEQPVVLAPVEVKAERAADSAYATPELADASKGGVALAENPQAISVVPESLIVDQGAYRLEDILRNVAGVQVGGYYNGWDYYRIRGFDAAFTTRVDGLLSGNGTGEEVGGLEAVEILKGPAALYGSGSPGGLVNAVSKRPRDNTFTRVEFTTGSRDYLETSLDANTPLGDSGKLFGRLNIIQRDQEFRTDGDPGIDSLYIAPSLTWKIGEDTELTILTRFRHQDVHHASPLPALGTVLPNPNGPISLDLNVAPPGSNRAEETMRAVGYEFTHRINDTFKVVQNARVDRYDQHWDDIIYPAYLDADNRTLATYPYDYDQRWSDIVVDTRLESDFETGALAHHLAAGVDYFRKDTEADYATIDFSDPGSYTYVDIYNPVYGAIGAMTNTGTVASLTDTLGFYAQDHVKLPARVTVTGGLRYDFARTDGERDEALTSNLGATWEFVPAHILYANYSESFSPQSGTTVGGTSLDPETGVNIEFGLRSHFLRGRLVTTAALFQLTRENVATADLLNPLFSVASGEQRSRGFEFDASFTPVKGWELLAAYAYTDTKITEDNTNPVGARLAGVPLHTVSTWTKYTFQDGPLRGFGVGAGYRYYSAQDGDLTYTNPFELPAYSLVEAALYYQRGPFSARLNVTNLLDKDYYSGAYNNLYVLPGDPRTVRLSVAWTF